MIPVTAPIRCAVYTRKSTEEGLEQAYNSLDAQRDAAEAYIRSQVGEGWVLVPEVYSDAAISGGTMERPALHRLLADVEAGHVQMVVVYKLDRLSRSLLDFATIAKLLETHGAGFVSVTEKFDTSSAIGKLHLNIILSFAQFERELASERIRDKFTASKKRGLWMGGYPPLGYDVVDRHLVLNPQEAQLVRHIFERFRLLHSHIHLVEELRTAGYRGKTFTTQTGKLRTGNPLTVDTLNKILRNPTYIGKVRHKDVVYDGQHEAIISQELWDSVQRLFEETKRRPRGRPFQGSPTSSILKGLVFCTCCASPLRPAYTRKKGRLYRYFTSGSVQRGIVHQCQVAPLPAQPLEDIVIGHLKDLLTQPEIVSRVWENLKALGEECPEHDITQHLTHLKEMWDTLFPDEQRKLILLLVKRIDVSPDGARIQLHATGFDSLIHTLIEQEGPSCR